MLNEKDFTEIGKRIYDLEADPPRKGWDKIAGGLKTQSGKGGFFSRNWWKPLIVIVPLSIWIAADHGFLKSDDLAANITQAPSMKTPALSSSPDEQKTKTTVKDSSATIQRSQHSGSNDVQVASDNRTIDKDGQFSQTETSRAVQPLINTAIVSAKEETKNTSENISSLDAIRDDNQSEKLADATVITSQDNLPVDQLPQKQLSEAAAAGVPKVTEETDSVTDEKVLSGVVQTEPSKDDIKKETSIGRWRVTAAFAPSYLIKSVRPVISDEVLVTKMENRKSIERLGFNAAFGAGKEVRRNLFIDAQLTFSSQNENFAYSYTTGQVDTLIAHQEENGSVRVIPVYATESAEISSRLNYGGIRLGGSYYFWSRGRTRFNISAAGAANFLLYSNVKENISGEWAKVDSGNGGKSLYTLTIGAGYNVRLGQAWELQINPSLTYYSGKGNSYQQILNFNQRSYGVTFMVSKFF